MARYCYLNGKLVPEKTAKVSVLDRGLLLGEGVFETMRAYNGKVFAIDRHLRRLRNGAKAMGLALPTATTLGDALGELLTANKLQDARVRLTVTSGPGGPGLVVADGVEPTVIVLAHPIATPDPRIYQSGMVAITLPMKKYAAAPLVGIKTVSYGENLAGRRMAADAGADEGIFLNSEGDVCEGTASNLFIVSYGKLLTPNLDSGCLPGITREVVLELARPCGLEPEEQTLSPIDLAQAEEAFLTSSTRELMPLVTLDGAPIGQGAPGEATRRLHQAYRDEVGVVCGPIGPI